LQARDEEYLKVAVTRLLPEYYGARPDTGTGTVLRSMADAMVARHRDAWLRDMLKAPHSTSAAEAFAALGRAVVDEDNDDWNGSRTEAQTAARLFTSAGSAAGTERAQFESVYTLQVRNRFAECASEGKELDRALRGSGYAWLRTQALFESAICARWDGDLNRAWADQREASEAADQSGYSVLSLRALLVSAALQRDIGNVAAAGHALTQGLTQYWKGGYPLAPAWNFYGLLSLLAPQMKVPYAAVAWANEAVATGKLLGYQSLDAGALHQLALTEISVGLLDLAAQHLRQASAALTRSPGDDQRLLQVIYAIELAEVEADLGEVERPIARLADVQEEAQRCEVPLRLRFGAVLGRLRLRQRRYAESRRLLEHALEIGESSRAALSEPDRVILVRAMGEIYRALVECGIDEGADPRQSWELWSRYRADLFGQLRAARPAADLVAPGEALLSFAELPSGAAAWLGTARGFRFRWLDHSRSKAMGEATDRLVRGFANPRSPEAVLREDARQLSQWLLEAWDSELDGVRTVAIESDGPLSQLPWPALVRANQHYWSEDFAIRIRVGAGRAASSSLPVASAQRILAVGEPEVAGDPDLPPLPDARLEAKNISSRFPLPVLLEGPTATLSEVRSRLEGAEVFHFAGHGYGGDGGGLILRGAGGGSALLTAAAIQDLNLSRCRLAVLSGCATGSGERDGPGDPQSLVRAFLHAGTREVVASLWNLDSAGTQVFMGEFYTAMFSGAPPDRSLRSAAAAMRAGREYRHPYYWAGLQVFDVQ
jgi:CHAT domain-containing protein